MKPWKHRPHSPFIIFPSFHLYFLRPPSTTLSLSFKLAWIQWKKNVQKEHKSLNPRYNKSPFQQKIPPQIELKNQNPPAKNSPIKWLRHQNRYFNLIIQLLVRKPRTNPPEKIFLHAQKLNNIKQNPHVKYHSSPTTDSKIESFLKIKPFLTNAESHKEPELNFQLWKKNTL